MVVNSINHVIRCMLATVATETLSRDPERIRQYLVAITASRETSMERPWTLDDATENYLLKQMSAVCLLEMDIIRLQGKWKTSQNQPGNNRIFVAMALEEQDDSHSGHMAELVKKTISSQ